MFTRSPDMDAEELMLLVRAQNSSVENSGTHPSADVVERPPTLNLREQAALLAVILPVMAIIKGVEVVRGAGRFLYRPFRRFPD